MKTTLKTSTLTLASLIIGLLLVGTSYSQVRIVTPTRNAGSTISRAPVRRITTVRTQPRITISQPSESQLIQQRNQQLLRQQGLPRIPNAQNPAQWRSYDRAMDQARREVLGNRYTTPSGREKAGRVIGVGLGILNSLLDSPRPRPKTIRRQ